MEINWIALGATLLTIIFAAWVRRRWFLDRPHLISYFSHIAAFRYSPDGKPPIPVHTHEVILRNVGRKSANNIRIHHNFLPHFNIYPPANYTVDELPDGRGKDILIPKLVPKEQVSISYLYFGPDTYADINAGIKYDDGFPQQIPVFIRRQYPKWIEWLAFILMGIGAATALYIGRVSFQVQHQGATVLPWEIITDI